MVSIGEQDFQAHQRASMYDYVIIGAGSAGCVLANRLTEDPVVKVLLLESGGPDRQKEIHMPAAFTKLYKGPCDWSYETQPQARLKDRRLFWPRGKVLGGSSSINAMIYIRGQRQDYDHWRDLGNEGWSYEEVLPYFKKAEDQERGACKYHGTGGPLHVADLRYQNPVSRALVEAAVNAGHPRNNDFNGPDQEGVGFYQVTQKGGKRHSTAVAYLRPALDRTNLTVRTRALATHLLVDKRRVLGVQFVAKGKPEEVRVDREVILSGGAVNSPHLLLLSGIGPADDLGPLGIRVRADLPGVGRNLQDHLVVPVIHQCVRPVTLANVETVANLFKYLLFKTGPLCSNAAECGGFIKTRPDLPTPDLQFHFVPACFLNHGLAPPIGHMFTIAATQLRPHSRGSVGLRSSDPLDPPAIQPNYLAEDADLGVLVGGVRLARRLAGARALDPFRGAEQYPGSQAQSEEAIIEYIRGAAETLYHPVGTCKMGHDPMAVVDARLRVHGIEGLRVVDASVMPTLVSGNTNARQS